MSKNKYKHKYTFYDTFDVPSEELYLDFAPSWWEGLALIIFYLGQKIIFWGIVIYLYFDLLY